MGSQITKNRYNEFMLLEEKIITQLIAQHKTIATAESCTGGLISSRLTDVSGSSKAFLSGIIAYSDNSKKTFLQVPAAILQNNGAVSEPVATAMAKNVREIHRADFGVGITGIAGPTGGTKTKPVGLVYIAVATAQEAVCLKCQFKGTRKQIKSQAATQALKLLKEFLE
ncbi:MAG TPA: CinA family protein [Candidatus Bathyarchaeia archaeon]|nr:CinA family protein [Candidatus Bathyarchaeia archaeon]